MTGSENQLNPMLPLFPEQVDPSPEPEVFDSSTVTDELLEVLLEQGVDIMTLSEQDWREKVAGFELGRERREKANAMAAMAREMAHRDVSFDKVPEAAKENYWQRFRTLPCPEDAAPDLWDALPLDMKERWAGRSANPASNLNSGGKALLMRGHEAQQRILAKQAEASADLAQTPADEPEVTTPKVEPSRARQLGNKATKAVVDAATPHVHHAAEVAAGKAAEAITSLEGSKRVRSWTKGLAARAKKFEDEQ